MEIQRNINRKSLSALMFKLKKKLFSYGFENTCERERAVFHIKIIFSSI